MAVRDDFAAGEVLAAADLNDTFASKLPYSYGTATPSTSVDGFLWYDENDTPPTPKFWDGAAFQALTSGKILQVVRDTATGSVSTTSTSFVDITGLSVTITPTKSDSAVLLIMNLYLDCPTNSYIFVRIADSSNNALNGAENLGFGQGTIANGVGNVTQIGYATPATTSAVTYKGRFRVNAGTGQIDMTSNTAQLYALEIGA